MIMEIVSIVISLPAPAICRRLLERRPRPMHLRDRHLSIQPIVRQLTLQTGIKSFVLYQGNICLRSKVRQHQQFVKTPSAMLSMMTPPPLQNYSKVWTMNRYLETFNINVLQIHSKDGLLCVFSFRWTPTKTLNVWNVFLLSIVAIKYGGVNSCRISYLVKRVEIIVIENFLHKKRAL